MVESMPIGDDLLEEHWEQSSVPVQEATSSGFAHDDLPAADHLELVVPVLDLLEFALIEHISIDEA